MIYRTKWLKCKLDIAFPITRLNHSLIVIQNVEQKTCKFVPPPTGGNASSWHMKEATLYGATSKLIFCHVVVHALITSVRGQRSPSLRNFDRRASWRSGSRWTTFSMIHCPLFSLIKNNAFFHWPSCKLFKSVQNSCSCWSSWVSPLVHTVARLVNFLPLHVEFYLVILLCCHHSQQNSGIVSHITHQLYIGCILWIPRIETSQDHAIHIDYVWIICYVCVP